MDERRKNAYRYLLYQAMLDIRPIAWLKLGNPLRWPGQIRQVRRSGVLADWLHNLAFCSSVDFDRFDEDWFWKDGRSLKAHHPELDLERYQRIFEDRICEATGG